MRTDTAIFKTFLESLRTPETAALIDFAKEGFELCFEATFEIPMKKVKGKKVKTTIPPSKRTLDNLPCYADGKSKVRFQDWLEMDPVTHSTGKGCDGKWYGWSHRALYGFKSGDKVKAGDVCYSGKDFIIKDEADAKRQAERFAKSVS